jgi:hypothetical protein
VEKVKKERAKRKNKNKNMYLYLAAAVAIIVIAFSAIEQFMRPTSPKVAAADYFETTDGVVLDAEMEASDNETLYLLQVRFNLTAVGGDAHRIVVSVPGFAAQEEWPYFAELKQNDTIDITLPEFQSPVRCVKNADGYFEFVTSLDCNEAKGKITILLE